MYLTLVPATVVCGGTSRITGAPIATVDHSPILMPGMMVAPAPTQAHFRHGRCHRGWREEISGRNRRVHIRGRRNR